MASGISAGVKIADPTISSDNADALGQAMSLFAPDGNKLPDFVNKVPDFTPVIKRSFKSFDEYYDYHKLDINEPWAIDYNEWFKNLGDKSLLQRHHVFSDKNDKIFDHKLFDEGLLDKAILNDKRNIMPLPTKEGLHPTMNTHLGGHTNEHNSKMTQALNLIKEDFDAGKITRDEIESRYWEAVKFEKESLYYGKSNLYKKDIERNKGGK